MAAVAEKPAPHSIEDLLLAARRDRKAVKQLLGQAVLNGRPDAEVKALQEELDLHTAAIERFTAAIEAKATAEAEQSFEARKAAVADARTTIAERDTEIAELMRNLLAGIETLAPQASRLSAAVTERNAALRTGLKAGLDKQAWSRLGGEGISPAPAIAAALGSALIEAGFPALGAHVDASRTGEDLGKRLQKVSERTEGLFRKADACLTAPADDEDEDDI